MRQKTASLVTTALAVCTAGTAFADAHATTVTIATVNNGDMIRMQGLTDDFNEKHPDITLEWVTLEENILRQRVTQDIATNGGQFDVLTIGMYETPIWAAQGWLVPLDDLGEDYDADDIIPAMRAGLSYEGTLYAAPFYGESSMVMYRTDLFDEAGLEMPREPTWEQIAEFARTLTDKDAEQYGICLRGKAGWGENMAFITTVANSFGARWFDEEWNAQLDSPEWLEAVTFYNDLMADAGPPGAATNGFNENLALFQQGKCGMWIDATVAASFVTNPNDSEVADSVGFALAPDTGRGKRANWLWAWALAVPSGSDATDAAKQFIAWATSKDYLELVASTEGWSNVPPGSRTSLYKNPEYAQVPFAEMTLESINLADPGNPTVDQVPYVGIQYVAIPEWQGIGTSAGQEFSNMLAGQQTPEEALARAQELVNEEMEAAGYR
ncbi:ABC transporter substrate-binding protein [Jannaschia aquimarina]|uniref:Putative ABC transporter-binding protein n=1 Tax=Jannaschia aquimarina TaxID=935700 RepID=A0A0D1EDK4_9RHOB|nr:sugar ABC transporter substrate-binding protein [Jannaschia aquimarina]KIT15774.1 putative ABC transporter-binding protein precursor [Jannaschia aquimarina]SNT31674.1 sorbitol-binding protein /mannitol-binding protein [Jannaschia aquimarina]